jgi:hypothetical protein
VTKALRTTLLLGALALAATGCGDPRVTVTQTLPGGVTVSVLVVDRTGLVSGVESADANIAMSNARHGVTLESAAGDASLVLTWLGPNCPSSATIVVREVGGRLSIAVNEPPTLQDCTNAMGRPRAVEIRFNRAVPVETVDAANISFDSPAPTQ